MHTVAEKRQRSSSNEEAATIRTGGEKRRRSSSPDEAATMRTGGEKRRRSSSPYEAATMRTGGEKRRRSSSPYEISRRRRIGSSKKFALSSTALDSTGDDGIEITVIPPLLLRGMILGKKRVSLVVEPITTVAELKSMLEAIPWIPKKHLVLFKLDPTSLQVDLSFTKILNNPCFVETQCGVLGSGPLLACVEGSYNVQVYSPTHKVTFEAPVESIFKTIGDVKNRIAEVTRLPRSRLILAKHSDSEKKPLEDAIPLFSLNIVKPYLLGMVRPYHLRLLLVPDPIQKGQSKRTRTKIYAP